MAAWFEVALKQMEEAPSEFFEVMEEDLDAESLGIREGAVLFRLRYGVERYTALGPSIPEDHVLQAAIPMVYDVPSPMEEHTSHEKRGGNVLFMDGHVEFVAYPKGFPFYPGVAWISECIRTGRGD
jgi:prepilin-type processing-associated H-X9-DG protein